MTAITLGTRVLVTGASGFIGSRLLDELVVRGAQVSGVSRRDRPDTDEISWRKVDLSDADAVDALFAEIDPHLVFHLSSWVSGRQNLHNVRTAFTGNVASAVNVLAAATASGCQRVVLAGSIEEPRCDDGDVPSSPYAVSKSAQTLYARFFRAVYQTPVVVARISMVYGPGQRETAKVVPYSILSGLNGRAAELGGGARPIDWIYIDDVVRGLITLGEVSGIEGRTLDVGSGYTTTVEEMVTRIAAKLDAPAPVIGTRPDRTMEIARCADPRETYVCTGFRPQVGLDAGLDATIAWFRTEHAAGRF